ncbi:MAG: hypothetical protein ACP5OG_03505 [Candidatus Nanoarchaeia archaeon]
MDGEILNWFGNLINYVIFVYIFTGAINSACFNVFDMSLSLIGLGASIFIQIISLISARLK